MTITAEAICFRGGRRMDSATESQPSNCSKEERARLPPSTKTSSHQALAERRPDSRSTATTIRRIQLPHHLPRSRTRQRGDVPSRAAVSQLRRTDLSRRLNPRRRPQAVDNP